MELHNNRPNNEQNSRLDAERLKRAPKSEIDSTIDRVHSARTEQREQVDGLTQRNRDLETRSSDSLDLSATARLFTGGASDESRSILVTSLKAAYETGNLNTQERIERAAHNLLAQD